MNDRWHSLYEEDHVDDFGPRVQALGGLARNEIQSRDAVPVEQLGILMVEGTDAAERRRTETCDPEYAPEAAAGVRIEGRHAPEHTEHDLGDKDVRPRADGATKDYRLVKETFDVRLGVRIDVDFPRPVAVSYTHLTLPTTRE